jgi:DnaK suppressor protein
MAAAKRSGRTTTGSGKKKVSGGKPAKARPSAARAGKETARKAAGKPAVRTTRSKTAAKPAPKKKAAPGRSLVLQKPKAAVRPPSKGAARPQSKPAGGPRRSAQYRPPNPNEPSDSTALIHGIPPYIPSPGENYMSDRQLEHFRQILLSWKRELMDEVDRTVHHMQDEASNFPDPNDRATQESEFGLELRTRDRERKLLKRIDSALKRIEDGSYGFCEETGEEIGLKRLEARPVAKLSVEAQERREMAERQYGEQDDRYR